MRSDNVRIAKTGHHRESKNPTETRKKRSKVYGRVKRLNVAPVDMYSITYAAANTQAASGMK